MSSIRVGEEVKYIGEDTGTLWRGRRGRVKAVGEVSVSVDFGGTTGEVPVSKTDVQALRASVSD